jgi:sulfite dehydrogenase (cytochrome) subunit B
LTRATLAILALLAARPALCDETAITLKKDAGLEAVQTNCATCHSLDYIVMNSPFPTEKMWAAEVNKMIKAFGAPIADKDVRVIIEYLTRNYGSL